MRNGNQIKADWLKIIGTALIAIGVSMWVVYAVGKYLIGWQITDREFLPYHLGAVIPGVVLRYHQFFFGGIRKWLLRKDK